MQKLQILFPDPLMERMRAVARRTDMPISEMVRRATEGWLERIPDPPRVTPQVPVVDAGRCLVGAEDMRELLYE